MKINIIVFVFAYIFQLNHGALCFEMEEDTWIEPNAWSREQNSVDLMSGLDLGIPLSDNNDQQCSDDKIAYVYYKKFIANLFNRNKLQYDKSSAVYRRALLFTLRPEQLAKLEQFDDPRDLDTILTEIFSNVRSPNKFDKSGEKGISNFALIMDIFKDLKQLLKHSEVQFTLLVAIAILLAWFVHRHYRINLVVIILTGILFFGFFVTYLECNRKLEVERMLEVIERSEVKELPRMESHWYTPIMKLFGSGNEVKETRQEKVLKSSKVNLAFCRPDHVVMLYANEIFFKQIELLMEKCTETFIKLKNTLSFPFNYIAAFMMVYMIGYIIKLNFKYILSPGAWANFFRSQYYSQPHQQHLPHQLQPQLPQSHSGVSSITEDRISGENLKILLNAFSAPTSATSTSKTTMDLPALNSGVQEILEQLELTSSSSSSSLTAKSLSKDSTPNDSLDAPIDAISENKQLKNSSQSDLVNDSSYIDDTKKSSNNNDSRTILGIGSRCSNDDDHDDEWVID